MLLLIDASVRFLVFVLMTGDYIKSVISFIVVVPSALVIVMKVGPPGFVCASIVLAAVLPVPEDR